MPPFGNQPPNNIIKKEESYQIPLFITGIPKTADLLTEQNIADLTVFLSPKILLESNNTLSGFMYLKLFSFASTHGITVEVLQKYLSLKGITVSSNLPPDTPTQIRYT